MPNKCTVSKVPLSEGKRFKGLDLPKTKSIRNLQKKGGKGKPPTLARRRGGLTFVFCCCRYGKTCRFEVKANTIGQAIKILCRELPGWNVDTIHFFRS